MAARLAGRLKLPGRLAGSYPGLGRLLSQMMLGMWLFVSAVGWPDTEPAFYNSWITGVLAVTFALAALTGRAWAWHLNAAVGAWLILSPIFMPARHLFTELNQPLVGV